MGKHYLRLATAFGIPVCHLTDHSSLLIFRAGFNDPYIGVFKSWTGPNCCNKWNGVTCDPITGRVADLSLHVLSERQKNVSNFDQVELIFMQLKEYKAKGLVMVIKADDVPKF